MKKKLFLLFSMGLMVFSDTNSELMKKMETFSKDAFICSLVKLLSIISVIFFYFEVYQNYKLY